MQKPKYQKPELIELTGMDSFGDCTDGSGDSQDCSHGNAAASSCTDGNAAGTAYADGNLVN
jgi:hypothetical protein